jgi:hypothetical protein
MQRVLNGIIPKDKGVHPVSEGNTGNEANFARGSKKYCKCVRTMSVKMWYKS